jgi:hypothetical protein
VPAGQLMSKHVMKVEFHDTSFEAGLRLKFLTRESCLGRGPLIAPAHVEKSADYVGGFLVTA